MRDQQMLVEEGRMHFIESWYTPLVMGFRKMMGRKLTFGEWFFPLQLTFEFHDTPPDHKKCLQNLNFYRHNHTEYTDIYDFANRLENLFELWNRSGYWANAHPWMETLLPWDKAERYISQVLSGLPPALLGGGHVLLWPSTRKPSTVPLFKTPDSDFIMGFGILPGIPQELLPQAVPMLNRTSKLSEALGGKRDLSGLIQFEPAH